MSQQEKHFYEFGEFRIDVTKRRLLRGGEIVPLTPKAFDVLMALAEQSGKMIEKDELMRKVWPDTTVEENNLTQNIYTLRKIFGESRNDSRYIATIPGYGYRFVAEVRRIPFDQDEVTIQEKTEARIIITETLEPTLEEARAEPVLRDALPPAAEPRRINKKVAGLFIVLAVVLVAAITYAIVHTVTGKPVETFRDLSVTQLTYTGTIPRAAISPDGKHIIYSTRQADSESLWLRQVATGSSQQIVAPEPATYYSLSFSHDGNYLFYVKRSPGDRENVLYRMPALGGIPTRLVEGMEPYISLSPDDRRIAFIRESASESMLLVSDIDGSKERLLAVRPITDYFKVPSWSPDGKRIACSVGSGVAYNLQNSVVSVNVEDGQQVPLTGKKWFYTRWVEWLSDGSGVLLTANDREAESAQIWYISYPQGEVRQITNDSKHYYSLSLTADSKAIAATQTQLLSEIWVSSLVDQSAPKKLTFGSGTYADACFDMDGRIIYSSLESGNMDIWRMNVDGTQKQRLTSDPAVDENHTISPDGRYIVFASNRAGAFNIWRMDSNGSNPVRLTTGSGEKAPRCSPDGKWVFYNSVASVENYYSLWKVPIEGGEPVLIADQTDPVGISPDGKHLAYIIEENKDASHAKLVVIPAAGGAPEKTFTFFRSTPILKEVRWTTDSQALLYPVVREGVTDIWMQPLDGGPPKQITDLKLEGRFAFEPSPDGKLVVFARRLWTYDLLLLSNFR